MSANEIHEDDIGTAFTITVQDDTTVVNISAATTKQIKFKKPSGTVVTKDGVFVTDGTDGQLRHTTVADDLDEAGKWYIQVYLVLTNWTGHSDWGSFMVFDNLS